MCGIAGIVSFHQPIEPAALQRMADSMRHRGPDDEGYVLIDSRTGSAEPRRGPETHPAISAKFITSAATNFDVAFAHRRLSILDVSPAGHQPMCDPSRTRWIVFNGEIYNYIELRAELQALGRTFHSTSDTEVLLAAYVQWGPDCLARLNGMFSFAVWDGFAKTLFAARDRCGEKPFHYFHTSGLFAFASEMKALFAGGSRKPAANPRILARYLVLGEIDCEDETFFDGIRRLPPAHYLLLHDGTLTVRRYWDLRQGGSRLAPPHAGAQSRMDARYAAEFLHLFTDAVSIRLRSDVPVGSCLSGGIDSSSIVALACELMAGKTRLKAGQPAGGTSAGSAGTVKKSNGFSCFSACFPGARVDESRFMKDIVAHAGSRWFPTFPTPQDLAHDIGRVVFHLEEPFISTSVYAQWKVMELAKKTGVTVLLDGQGADEPLAGYHGYFCDYYKALLREWRFADAAGEIAKYRRVYGRLVPYFLRALLPQSAAGAYRRAIAAGCLSGELFDLARCGAGTSLRADMEPLTAKLYLTLATTSVPQLTRYCDRNSMAFSREVRLPFLDPRLLEFLFAIPRHQILRGATTKVVLRNAMTGMVPDSVRLRKDKIGFETPEESWFRGGLAGWLADLFASATFAQRGWWERNAVQAKWRSYKNGGSARLRDLIWRIACAETWARVFGL